MESPLRDESKLVGICNMMFQIDLVQPTVMFIKVSRTASNCAAPSLDTEECKLLNEILCDTGFAFPCIRQIFSSARGNII